MTMLVVRSITFFIFLCIGSLSHAMQLRSLSYETVREEGGFDADSLEDVTEIRPSGRTLNEEELLALIHSHSLKNLRTLDLAYQPLVKDWVIADLVKNPTFSRLITLRLSGTDVTDASIYFILYSPVVGSIRDMPHISGKYGLPSSRIRVHARDTHIEDTERKDFFDFHIEYKPPFVAYPWEPVNHGVKIVEVDN